MNRALPSAKWLRLLPAAGLFVAVACKEDLPQLDAMTGQIVVGEEYCNWTPIDSSSAMIFDLGAGFEMKEAIGVSLQPSGYWLQDPADPSSKISLEGILTAESNDATLLEVFSAPDASFALLAHKAGDATLTFHSAGHPGSFVAKVKVVASDLFVDTTEVAPEDDGGTSSSSSSSSSGAAATDSGTDAGTTEGGAQ